MAVAARNLLRPQDIEAQDGKSASSSSPPPAPPAPPSSPVENTKNAKKGRRGRRGRESYKRRQAERKQKIKEKQRQTKEAERRERVKRCMEKAPLYSGDTDDHRRRDQMPAKRSFCCRACHTILARLPGREGDPCHKCGTRSFLLIDQGESDRKTILPPAFMRSYREPDEIHERTPTRDEIRDVSLLPSPFRDFLKLLRAREMRFVTPKPLETSVKYHCSENSSSYLHSLGSGASRDYSIIFGFVVYIDPGCGFFRANGHMWVQNEVTKEWIDPTPTCDENDKELLLVRSDRFLTLQERRHVIASPNSYALGAMVSHPIVPPGLDKMDRRMRVVGMMFHKVNTPAEELRLYSLTQHGFGSFIAEARGPGGTYMQDNRGHTGFVPLPGSTTPMSSPGSSVVRRFSFETQRSDPDEDVTNTEVAKIMRRMTLANAAISSCSPGSDGSDGSVGSNGSDGMTNPYRL